MKIFLSWAGDESRQLAVIFESWLRKMLQTSKPWMSSNIDKGEGWDKEIHAGLDDTKIGILFLTRDSIESKYLHYEAGAISNVPNALVCTFLYNIKNTDVTQPLSRFQNTKYEKGDILHLVKTINKKIKELGGGNMEDVALVEMFDIMWPILKTAIEKVVPVTTTTTIPEAPIRDQREILEEILEKVRSISSPESESRYRSLEKSLEAHKKLAQHALHRAHVEGKFYEDPKIRDAQLLENIVDFDQHNKLSDLDSAISSIPEIIGYITIHNPDLRYSQNDLISVLQGYFEVY